MANLFLFFSEPIVSQSLHQLGIVVCAFKKKKTSFAHMESVRVIEDVSLNHREKQKKKEKAFPPPPSLKPLAVCLPQVEVGG